MLPASFSVVVLSPPDSLLFAGSNGEEIRGESWRRGGCQLLWASLVEQLPEASAGGGEASGASHAFLMGRPGLRRRFLIVFLAGIPIRLWGRCRWTLGRVSRVGGGRCFWEGARLWRRESWRG